MDFYAQRMVGDLAGRQKLNDQIAETLIAKYVLVETKAPEGYVRSEKEESVIFAYEDGNTKEIEITKELTNERIPTVQRLEDDTNIWLPFFLLLPVSRRNWNHLVYQTEKSRLKNWAVTSVAVLFSCRKIRNGGCYEADQRDSDCIGQSFLLGFGICIAVSTFYVPSEQEYEGHAGICKSRKKEKKMKVRARPDTASKATVDFKP